MAGRNNLLVLGICFLLSGAVHASHLENGANTVFGPGNSGAARIDDYFGTDTQPSCVGDLLSTVATTTGGLDIPAVMDGDPGSITTGISEIMGLGVVLGLTDPVLGGNEAFGYDSCGEQFIGESSP